MNAKERLHILGLLSVMVALSGCATPATEVKVKTMSMDAAYQKAQGVSELGMLAKSYGAVEKPVYRPAPSIGIVSAPDIRMVYVMPWVDNENNKHFGEWIAIPVHGYRWVMSDGAPIPIRQGTVSGELPPTEDQSAKPSMHASTQ